MDFLLESVLLLAAEMLLLLLTGVGAYRLGMHHGRRQRAALDQPVLPAQLYDELADLRHLKAQFDNPPQHHEHVWPREPDLRKMGWLRYKCAYGGCSAVNWVPN